MSEISFAEWVEVVASKEPPPRPPDALTISEWARKLNVKWDTAKRRIMRAVEAGEVVMERHFIRLSNGAICEHTCYRPRPTAKKRCK
jgi:hypothetical protein